jgi:hypothetical protein
VQEKLVYYLEPFKKFIKFDKVKDKTLFSFSTITYTGLEKQLIFTDADWQLSYELTEQ